MKATLYCLTVLALGSVAAGLGMLVVMVISGANLESPRAADEESQPLTPGELYYVAQAILRLRNGESREAIERSLDPRLVPSQMMRGDVGTLPDVRVLQVLGKGNILADWDGVTFWVAGVNTENLVDDRWLEAGGQLFECLGPASYSAASGVQRTVMRVQPFEPKRARLRALKRLAEEAEKRKKWVVKYELAGTTSQESPVFTVQGEQLRLCWEWKSTETDRSGSMLVNLHDGKGNSTLLEKCEEARGTRPLERGGTFQLSVAAFARDYKLWIESRE